MNNPTRLMTIREAEDRLAVSRETLRKWTKAGRLTAVRLGPRSIRFREEEVEDLAQGRGRQWPGSAHSHSELQPAVA
jgi:excisionase family DNA binding protein